MNLNKSVVPPESATALMGAIHPAPVAAAGRAFKNVRSRRNRFGLGHTLRAVGCAVGLLLPGLLSAQDFSLDWFAIAGGGGDSSGGDFGLSATIGQSDTGNPAGGDFAVTGGFWSIVTVVETPGAPLLSVGLVGGQLAISWPDSGSPGFLLEETTAVANPGSWTPVNITLPPGNGTNSVSLPIAAGSRFYRLRKP